LQARALNTTLSQRPNPAPYVNPHTPDMHSLGRFFVLLLLLLLLLLSDLPCYRCVALGDETHADCVLWLV
jgi:hypothetical protein